MAKFPQNLSNKLELRRHENALRQLKCPNNLVDFSSNDYLGLAKSHEIFDRVHEYLLENNLKINGATGSRLLSGNHMVYAAAESAVANFHNCESALIFNSGYDANVGFFGSVPQRNDVILYDALSHASIRDGMRMSGARSYKFGHNDLEELEILLEKYRDSDNIYVVTESVFSMDGDCPNLEQMAEVCTRFNALLVVDEAHALGVFGESGAGLVQGLGLENKVFARIVTYGKSLGCHGAAVLGSAMLKDYLVNFARSFIYTTALSPHAVANILIGYEYLENNAEAIQKLKNNIVHFNQEKARMGLRPMFVYSKSAIQCAIVPGNVVAKALAEVCAKKGFDVKAILSPTVPAGQERLRICLHSYNSAEEITGVLEVLMEAVFG